MAHDDSSLHMLHLLSSIKCPMGSIPLSLPSQIAVGVALRLSGLVAALDGQLNGELELIVLLAARHELAEAVPLS